MCRINCNIVIGESEEKSAQGKDPSIDRGKGLPRNCLLAVCGVCHHAPVSVLFLVDEFLQIESD